MEIEIIRFEVPTGKDHVVYLPKIKWENSREELWFEIHKVFSTFGLIYRVFTSKSSYYDKELKSFYSYIRFFSKKAAKKALHHSGRISINGQNLKICKSHKDYEFENKKLSSYESEQLMFHYFGFNFWNCEITNLEKQKVEGESTCFVKYVCRLRITTKDGLWSDGIGIGEAETLNFRELGNSYKTALRFAVQKAKIDAFSKFLIVSLSNGKCMIEVDTTRPDSTLVLDPTADNIAVKTMGELINDPDDIEEGEWIEDLSDTQLDNLLDVDS